MTEISAMYEALDNMDDYALMANVKPIGPHKVLIDAIAELEQLRQRVAELEMERVDCGKLGLDLCEQFKQLTAERDALKQQRDELLAALGSGGRHCNDDTPHSNLCEAIIDSKEADLGQGLDQFWKWAFRRGFHEAETSYKVDIATLEQQRDGLLAALERSLESFEYIAKYGNSWGYSQLRIPDLKAVIASVKEKQND